MPFVNLTNTENKLSPEVVLDTTGSLTVTEHTTHYTSTHSIIQIRFADKHTKLKKKTVSEIACNLQYWFCIYISFTKLILVYIVSCMSIIYVIEAGIMLITKTRLFKYTENFTTKK